MLFSGKSRFLLSRADTHTPLSINIEGNVILQTTCIKSGITGWPGTRQVGSTTLVHIAGAQAGFRCRDEI